MPNMQDTKKLEKRVKRPTEKNRALSGELQHQKEVNLTVRETYNKILATASLADTTRTLRKQTANASHSIMVNSFTANRRTNQRPGRSSERTATAPPPKDAYGLNAMTLIVSNRNLGANVPPVSEQHHGRRNAHPTRTSTTMPANA